MKLLGRIQLTMPPNKKKGPNNRAPPTREMEYRMIIDHVNDICIKIRTFAKKYLDRKAVDYSACSECLSVIVKKWGMTSGDFKTWKEFSDMLKAVEIDVDLKKSEIFRNLEYICERARKFEAMIPGIREQLVSCGRDHLTKYCQSFIADIGSLDIRPIFDYDEAIKNFKKDIDYKIEQINSNILTYGEMKIPFERFVAEGNVHGTLMEEVCVAVVEVSHVMKQWVSEDAVYPERILQEIFFNNSYKEKLEDDIVKLHQQRHDIEKALDKKQKHFLNVEREHEIYKRDKRKLKNHLQIATDKLDKLNGDLDVKFTDISKLQGVINDKTPRSHRDKQELNMKLERSEKQAERVKEWRIVMERQQARLERELKQVSDRTYELKVEGVTLRHEDHEIRQSLIGVDIEIKSIRERISSIENKTESLKAIRVKKLSPDTLRRIHTKRIEPSNKGINYVYMFVLCLHVTMIFPSFAKYKFWGKHRILIC